MKNQTLDPKDTVIDFNGVPRSISAMNQSLHNYPSFAQKVISDTGEPALTNCVTRESPCGCQVVGNGTLPFPLMIKHCSLHSVSNIDTIMAAYKFCSIEDLKIQAQKIREQMDWDGNLNNKIYYEAMMATIGKVDPSFQTQFVPAQ